MNDKFHDDLHDDRREDFLDHDLPQRYLKTPEAARYMGLSIRTLEKHRSYGTGPRFFKIGGRVVYALGDLDAWVARGRKRATFDTGSGTVLPAKRHSKAEVIAASMRRRG